MGNICGDNRFEIIAKAKKHLLESTNIDSSEEEMKVLDNFLFRCWQMNWLERYDKPREPLDIPTISTDFVKEQGLPCPNGYIFKDENGNVINAQKIVLKKKKKEYPKTFEECVHVLEGENRMSLEQMNTFRKLIDARNAYWKLYGEEMGLGKPWEPKWTSFLGYPAIYMYRYQITLSVAKDEHHLLVFPTEEMRDAFYENFKSEIEQCKELL